ncbi:MULTISPECIES: YqaA family protein [Nitrospirillum]|uniref:Membrane protein YqaA with SNARE-associated domain n=1 Tax=Nitrospirillum amazonense TaxID=28077 RepID=A0A560F6A5_9PROT|nr:YqaA family protein [Nitrospirillum amazonense]TWB16920.1 membrane protein YqaA with SNARE-associated domain [Nitrospirillum amazonense]TWB17148.1 membrane protein YqaA with SNARE-associated domain [Nitrospirillum amazonense]
MLRSLYDRTLALAGHRHAVWALAGISFIESSVFPIPPDLLLIPLILADRRRAFFLATVCTVASVLGGFLGYAIGYYFWDTIGHRVIEAYGLMGKYMEFKQGFDEKGAWIIILKGMTPIPYKLVTIASGAFQFDLATFAGASLISRALRFFLVAALLWKFGEPIRTFVEKRLTLVTTVALLLVISGFILVKYLHL